jgi:hypothetical protein
MEMRQEPKVWSDEVSAALKRFIHDGLSASTAADRLSEQFQRPFTRGMCLSKSWQWYRAGEIEHSFHSRPKRSQLASIPVDSKPEIRHYRVPFPDFLIEVAQMPLQPHSAIVLSKPKDISGAISLLDVHDGLCRWPISADPRLGIMFLVCGKETHGNNGYCDECQKFAWKDQSLRR